MAKKKDDQYQLTFAELERSMKNSPDPQADEFARFVITKTEEELNTRKAFIKAREHQMDQLIQLKRAIAKAYNKGHLDQQERAKFKRIFGKVTRQTTGRRYSEKEFSADLLSNNGGNIWFTDDESGMNEGQAVNCEKHRRIFDHCTCPPFLKCSPRCPSHTRS